MPMIRFFFDVPIDRPLLLQNNRCYFYHTIKSLKIKQKFQKADEIYNHSSAFAQSQTLTTTILGVVGFYLWHKPFLLLRPFPPMSIIIFVDKRQQNQRYHRIKDNKKGNLPKNNTAYFVNIIKTQAIINIHQLVGCQLEKGLKRHFSGDKRRYCK